MPEIDQQRARDEEEQTEAAVLRTRVNAVVEAYRAMRAGQTGAAFALRQAFIDLAALCEQLADKQPEPTLWTDNG